MKKKRQGFTLIELLAVIVILGLLLAIAIPSVTKYITQSRKKTVTTTIGNYIGALTNQVNDMEYVFTESNTVYAVPIECISLERGGTDPFGEWMQANDSYWAYVLVQYDDETSSYTYGFTFKDSAGYGLYPTTTEKLNESGKQINTDLDLTRPSNGTITNITEKANWTGFDLEDDTKLVVLEAESEGTLGDGKTTCTLCQKGDNYSQVEEDKKISKEEKEEIYINETTAYAIYSEDDNSLTFVRSKNEIKAGDVYDGKNVTNIFTNFENTTSVPWRSISNNILSVTFKDIIKPKSTREWFKTFNNCSNFDLKKLNTSNVKDMSGMFYNAGFNTTIFKLDLSTFDTSNVTNVSTMFLQTGYYSTTVEINLSNWNTSQLISMSNMFQSAGNNATTFKVYGLSEWDTSNVTSLHWTFADAGENATTFTIGDLSNWDVSKVTSMYATFCRTGASSSTWSIGNLSNWNVSNVTNMEGMFSGTGANSTIFDIGNLDNWDTSKVTDMSAMFHETGYNSTVVNIGNLSKWNTSKVTDMSKMFYYIGYKASTLNVGNLSNWDTSNVKNMWCMFMNAGFKASWSLDCSKWNVDKVTSYSSFNTGVTSKVTPPTWVN